MPIDNYQHRGEPVRVRALITASAIALLTTACTSTPQKPAASAPRPSSSTSSAASASPSPSPSPSIGPFALGETWKWDRPEHDVSGSSAVLSYQQRVARDATDPEEAFGSESKGYVWSAVELKVCNDADSGQVLPTSSAVWKLAYDDGALVDPSSTIFDQFPKPWYPFDAELKAGRCVRGKLVFAVPGGQRPDRVVYGPEGLEPVEWTIPKR